MRIDLFTIAFCLAMLTLIIMVFMLRANSNTLPVVKAGNVRKRSTNTKLVYRSLPKRFNCDGQCVDVSQDENMIVAGNSMRNCNIRDGQCVYVRRMTQDESANISTHPVLVFKIVDYDPNDAQYKLRKFVGYYLADCEETFKEYKSRIRLTLDEFSQQIQPKFERLSGKGRLILSETYDEDKNSVVYSLHPASTVYGKVEYAV